MARDRTAAAASLVAGTAPPDVVELWDWHLHPGEAHRSDPHSAGTRELLLVLEGEVDLLVGEVVERLGTGSSATFAGDAVHGYAAVRRRDRPGTVRAHRLPAARGRSGTVTAPGSTPRRSTPRSPALRPDYRAVLLTVEGLQGGPSDAVSERLLVAAEETARARLGGRAPEELPHLASWREAYRAFGAKPQRTRPSVEALLRRLDGGLPRIDRVTDAYNAVSVAHAVPVGGEDLDRYRGPARLVRATGAETFDTTAGGEPVVEHPDAGEVVWRDDEGVTCRRWNWRQCTRTRITTATTRAFFVVDVLDPLTDDEAHAAADALTEALLALSPAADVRRRSVLAA